MKRRLVGLGYGDRQDVVIVDLLILFLHSFKLSVREVLLGAKGSTIWCYSGVFIFIRRFSIISRVRGLGRVPCAQCVLLLTRENPFFYISKMFPHRFALLQCPRRNVEFRVRNDRVWGTEAQPKVLGVAQLTQIILG